MSKKLTAKQQAAAADKILAKTEKAFDTAFAIADKAVNDVRFFWTKAQRRYIHLNKAARHAIMVAHAHKTLTVAFAKIDKVYQAIKN